jgi:hypothetical protein
MVISKRIDMTKRLISITVLLIIYIFPSLAQEKKQGSDLKREVTLYNPYKPSLPESRKKSFLPDMADTTKVKPDFRYEVNADPYLPKYTISPIKAAALLPDPLTKLYKSYVNIGMGNYITPLAEISITNERSKKGSIGLYARHFSSNGKIQLQNDEKVFAGYMDNDVSLFGRKAFKKVVIESSVDLSQKVRYAYGYDTTNKNYSPAKKDIKLPYYNAGWKGSLSSLNLDSADFSYDFDLSYDFFYNDKNLYQHSVGVKGLMSKTYKGFYVGSGVGYNLYRISDSLLTVPKFVLSVSPFISKATRQWNFRLGFQALIDRNMDPEAEFHLYPDIRFGFSVVPEYINFFAGLSGRLEENVPVKIIEENPFVRPFGNLFTLPNTDHQLIVSTGLKGNNGIGGEYLVSASYSLINDMLFYSNISFPGNPADPNMGNHFLPVADDVELLNIRGEISGRINDKLTFNGEAGYNKYTLAINEYAWNKPAWNSRVGLKYNLRDKIVAGMELTAEGKRRFLVTGLPSQMFVSTAYFNLNLSAEYRYSKILSFWTKFNNISPARYYEWAYYPSQRFLCMVGFTYSL